jgi:molybdate transport system substrate-binding protein
MNAPRRSAFALALVLALPVRLRAEELLVFAAASLTDALTEIARAFEAESGHRVVLNFAGSSDLARQIRAGAPADVFFSADREQADTLVRAGLVRVEDTVDLLSNVLVVVVPATPGASAVAEPADLLRLPRVALANPEAVPAGVYARRWLEARGLWNALRERVVPTLDVRAALAAVASGSVDAAIVYRTDAALSPRVRIALEVPREAGPEIVYCLALIGDSRPAARDLSRFLLSSRARAIYRRFGFVVIAPE